MNLKEFIKGLNDLVEKNPEALDYIVVSSKDDEGNGFNVITYAPGVGHYNEKDDEFHQEILKNAVCIN